MRGAIAGVIFTLVMFLLMSVLGCFVKDGPWEEDGHVMSSQYYLRTNPFVLVAFFLSSLVFFPAMGSASSFSSEPSVLYILGFSFALYGLIGAVLMVNWKGSDSGTE